MPARVRAWAGVTGPRADVSPEDAVDQRDVRRVRSALERARWDIDRAAGKLR